MTENYDYEPENQQKAYILVAEDYEPNQDVAKMHLTTAGHTVDIAADGKEAVAMCEQNHYDIILMDIQMPEMDGFAATRLIRSGDSPCCDVPIIGLTANAEGDTQQGCLDAGMNDVTTKPIRRKHLCNVVNKWLNYDSLEEASTDSHQFECSSDKPFDFEQAVEEFGGNSDVVTDLIGKFLADAEIQVKNIVEALESEDVETIRQGAHKIRGAAGNLVAMPLSRAAQELEELAKSGQLDDAVEKVKALEEEFDRLKEYV